MSIKQIEEQAHSLGISVAELIEELQRGGKPDRPYVLILRFDRMAKMLDFVRDNWDEEEVGVWPGNALDPEFRTFGRAPKNHFILRRPDDYRVDETARVDKREEA